MSETRKTMKFMLKTAWKEKPVLYAIYVELFLAEVIARMQVVLLPKFLLDELVAVVNGDSRSEHIRLAILYAGITIGLTLLTNLAISVCNNRKEVYAEWFNEYFEIVLADKVMGMDYEHTEDPDALDQVEKAREGISWYSGGVVGILNELYNIIMSLTVLAGVATLILVTCPMLLPIQFLSLLIMLILNAKNNKIEVEQFKKLAKSNRIFMYLYYQLSDFCYGKDIRLYDSTRMMKDKVQSHTRQQVGVWADTQRMQRKNKWGMDLVNALRDGFSYFYIGLLAVSKKITIGEFSMCVSSASTLYWSLNTITSGTQEITKRCSYAHQFIRFLDYPEAMRKGNQGIDKQTHEIEFSHVSFKYPRSEKYVLRDINLKIRSGEHLSIVGVNGSGKTTFIKLLCRLYDVTEGAILIDGRDIREYSEEEYIKLFAVIFQDFKLFAFSLRENILLGEKEDEEELERVLKLAGIYEDAVKLEQGLDTMLYKSFDEHGTELSGGQQQKTAISRALYKDSPIVILDEPTAALDPVAEYDIYRQFNQLVGGKTAIYISHRLSSCKFCDKIAVFAEDTIQEYGIHDELILKKDGIYAEMFATQAQYYVDYAS